MKDLQPDQSGQLTSIPVISPCLHCVAMTVIVYLRSSFGIVYLRPKSIFLAFSWAIMLFTIVVWYEPYLWNNCWYIAHFLIVASALYCIHLGLATYRQLKRIAEHDQYAGTSHILRFIPAGIFSARQEEFFEYLVHIWIEPLLVLLAALILRVCGESYLSTWLFFVAGCFWLKELINYWLGIRREKRAGDMRLDMEESTVSDVSRQAKVDTTIPVATGRKAGSHRPRSAGPSEED